MDVFQNIIRIYIKKTKIDRIPFNTLLTMIRLTPLSTLVKYKKLAWFSHLKRGDLGVRAVYEGMVSAKKRRGTPVRIRRNDIYEWTG